MEPRICNACGTQYPVNKEPEICQICEDERQYVPEDSGQLWTTHRELLKEHSSRILQVKENVYEIKIVPHFAIGQRALLILSESGNVLWDCSPLLTEGVKAFIREKGGLDAIAFSHPHYYSNMSDWAQTFDCPIYIHQKDEQWIMDKSPYIKLWKGEEHTLWDGMRILNIGGHFPGSSILHVPFLSKIGTVFCGDTLFIAPSKKHISLIYSAPNRIPLPRREVKRIEKRIKNIPFDALYGFWSHQNLTENVKDILKKSISRYLA